MSPIRQQGLAPAAEAEARRAPGGEVVFDPVEVSTDFILPGIGAFGSQVPPSLCRGRIETEDLQRECVVETRLFVPRVQIQRPFERFEPGDELVGASGFSVQEEVYSSEIVPGRGGIRGGSVPQRQERAVEPGG